MSTALTATQASRSTTPTSHPRLGFAYSVTPTTVVRGGYGLSFFPGNYTSNANLKNAPFVSVYSPNCQQSLNAIAIQEAAGLPASSLNSHCLNADGTYAAPGHCPRKLRRYRNLRRWTSASRRADHQQQLTLLQR